METFQSKSEPLVVHRKRENTEKQSNQHFPNVSKETTRSVLLVRDEFKKIYKNFAVLSSDERKTILINFWYKNVENIERILQDALGRCGERSRIKAFLKFLLKVFYTRWTFLENVILEELHNDQVDQAVLTVMVAVADVRKFVLKLKPSIQSENHISKAFLRLVRMMFSKIIFQNY